MTQTTVDGYLADQPEPQRSALEALRARIHQLLPDAEETISYGIPAFRSGGRIVVWIAGWKAHCSIYPLDDGFVARHADELRAYELGKGTLRFSPDRPLSDELLADLIRARLALSGG